MKQLRLELLAVTPLFLGGSDPKGAPELRPASIRGALRWWYRAILGAPRDDARVSLADVRRGETSVFGETDLASPIVVRAGQPPNSAVERRSLPERSAINYLWYGLNERQGRGRDVTLLYRPAFRPGTPLMVTLQTRPSRRSWEREFEGACRALWLLVALGGLGSRSRRGAGRAAVRSVAGDWPDSLPPLDLHEARSPAELANRLRAGLAALHGAPRKSEHPPLPYATLRPDRYELIVFDKRWSTWEETLGALGESFRSFRSRFQPDYDTVKQFITNGTVARSVDRAAFGLPLPFYYRSLGGGKALVDGQGYDRSASPLRLLCWPLAGGGYAAGLLFFKAPLLPPRVGLRLRSGGTRGSAPAPASRIVYDYLNATLDPKDESFIAREVAP